MQSLAIENVKSEVIHGHVVPDRLLFTMPSNPSKTEKTATYEVREDDNDKDFPLVVAAIQPQGRNGKETLGPLQCTLKGPLYREDCLTRQKSFRNDLAGGEHGETLTLKAT